LLALLVLAAAFWGQAPPCQPTITRADLPPPIVGFANLADCSITVDPPPFAGAECMVVLHEYGHLLGLSHSEDPNDVMYPVIRTPIWPCKW
jgi:hypothetical protein